MNPKAHWDMVYRDRSADQLSWYQPEPAVSLSMIRDALPEPASRIIDVGGGASALAERLAEAGYQRVTVLDLSGAALAAARSRMDPVARGVEWIEGDVLTARLPSHAYDLWHDRAVFHFLIDPADRGRYVAQARSAVRAGGLVLIATFAADGPSRCSGLEVARYAPEELQAAFGPDFVMVRSVREEHRTPDGRIQPFTYCLFRLDPRRPE